MSRSGLSGLVARGTGTLRALRGAGRGWTLLAIAAGWFLVLGLRFVIPALLPVITDEFTVSNATAGGAITLLWVTYALMQFPAGALVSRAGERRLLAASLFVSAVSLVALALAPQFGVFLVAIAAFGLGTGLYGPARGTALSRLFRANEGAAFGTVLAMGSVGAALLPALATGIAVLAGWRLALGITVPAFVGCGALLWWAVPAREPLDTARPVTDGGVLTPSRTLLDAIATRRVALAVAAATLMLFTFQGLTAFLTTYLVDAKGTSEGLAGALFGLMFLAGAGYQTVGGSLADRFGFGPVLAASALGSVVPLVALPFLDGILPLVLALVLIGLRFVIAPLSNAYIIGALPAPVRGTAWGFLRTGFMTVGAFGSVLVGVMADADLFAEAFIFLAALTAVAGVLYLFLPARERAVDREPAT